MVKAARVRSDGTFYDPFCGSGTLLIEATMTACHIAPGMARRFSAENWGIVPGNVWQREREAAALLFCAMQPSRRSAPISTVPLWRWRWIMPAKPV